MFDLPQSAPAYVVAHRRPAVLARLARRVASRVGHPAARFAAIVLRVVLLGACLAAPLAPATATARVARPYDVGTIAVAQLPPQGRDVLQAIEAGGPFVSRRDGIVFGNREGILPRQPRGYYAEYTVPTPGASTRGARRIIAGRGTTGDFRTSNEYYYTNDHYQSFRRIVQ